MVSGSISFCKALSCRARPRVRYMSAVCKNDVHKVRCDWHRPMFGGKSCHLRRVASKGTGRRVGAKISLDLKILI